MARSGRTSCAGACTRVVFRARAGTAGLHCRETSARPVPPPNRRRARCRTRPARLHECPFLLPVLVSAARRDQAAEYIGLRSAKIKRAARAAPNLFASLLFGLFFQALPTTSPCLPPALYAPLVIGPESMNRPDSPQAAPQRTLYCDDAVPPLRGEFLPFLVEKLLVLRRP